MLDRNSLILWSLPMGRVAGTEIRLSWTLAALALLLCISLGPQLGLVFFCITMVMIVLHEFGHVFAARATGGSADEILLWLFGGLAPAQPGPGYLSQFLTAGAGPLVNLVICALCFPGLYAPERLPGILLPFVPNVALQPQTLAVDLLLLTFSASWVLLLINLLPVFPFDCGQMLYAVLASQLPAEKAHRGLIFAGFAVAVLLMFGGLIWQLPTLVLLGAIVMVVNVMQSMQGGATEYADDSFMGYDFSQGYTSLERSSGKATDEEPRLSRWQQWKARRQAQREQEARERQLQDEAQLDALLAKVHEHGFQSLTVAEKRLLERVSTDFRERSKRQT